MEINVSDVSLYTVKVEIKVLSLNGKQMTLAVFRQLMREDPIDYEDLEIHGNVWGIVNYHYDRCFEAYGSHIHIVWQKANILRRCVLPKNMFNCNFGNEEVRKWLRNLEQHTGWTGAPGREPLEDYESKWKTLYDRLSSLDQLFIAV